jgi:hypothetical protein
VNCSLLTRWGNRFLSTHRENYKPRRRSRLLTYIPMYAGAFLAHIGQKRLFGIRIAGRLAWLWIFLSTYFMPKSVHRTRSITRSPTHFERCTILSARKRNAPHLPCARPHIFPRVLMPRLLLLDIANLILPSCLLLLSFAIAIRYQRLGIADAGTIDSC